MTHFLQKFGLLLQPDWIKGVSYLKYHSLMLLFGHLINLESTNEMFS